jgi:hypothetical protein
VNNPTPLSSTQRVERYQAQTGAKALTPRQRRRMDQKQRRNPVVDAIQPLADLLRDADVPNDAA